MKAKEVTERAMKNREGKDGRKNKGFSVVSKLDTDLQHQSGKEIQRDNFTGKMEEKQTGQTAKGGNIRKFKKGNRHQEILREWGRESVSLTVITEAVTEAMQKVSNLDTMYIGRNRLRDKKWQSRGRDVPALCCLGREKKYR